MAASRDSVELESNEANGAGQVTCTSDKSSSQVQRQQTRPKARSGIWHMGIGVIVGT